MSKLSKEIFIGIIPVVLLFVVFLNVKTLPFIIVLSLVIAIVYFSSIRQKITGANSRYERRGKKQKPSFITFEDIGGQASAKKELMEALDFLIHQEDIQKYGIRPLKGILLTGPPGTGKTLMAKAAAHYTDSVFASASGSEFVEMYVGVGASRVREIFKEVRTKAEKENKASAIIFIDEIEVIGSKRDGGQHKEYDQTLNQLLTEMDGIHSNDQPRILLIAATNRKEMLDSALLRPGRFDRHIEVELPDRAGRLHILKLQSLNKPLAESVSLERIADETFGFSGAQLESLLNEAAVYALREKASKLEQHHLSLAIDKVLMGESTDKKATNEEKIRVALHELGHAITAEHIRPGSVSQVSLRPRGQALGYVRHQPQKEQYLYTKSFLEEQIMISLGGSVAEEMFYGGRSTGSRNDFEQATQLVMNMIASGLTRLGIVNMDIVNKDALMQENDFILSQLTEQTRQLLESYREVFNQSIDILMKEEVMSGDQFRMLMKQLQDRLEIDESHVSMKLDTRLMSKAVL